MALVQRDDQTVNNLNDYAKNADIHENLSRIVASMATDDGYGAEDVYRDLCEIISNLELSIVDLKSIAKTNTRGNAQ